MRWFKGSAENTAAETTRIVEKFLWWPLSIGGEVRWLEKAKWWEECEQYIYTYTGRESSRKWEKVEWVDKE